VLDIAKKLNCDVSNTDISTAHRVPHYPGTNNQRPKTIVARFISRDKRNALLAAARSKKGLNTDFFGFINFNSASVFINEHLTQENKNLLWKAREACKVKNYKYCWVRDTKICVRKTDGSTVIHIKNENSLSKIA